MNGFRIFLRWIFAAAILGGGGSFVVLNYSWVFAKRVKGRIIDVERVTSANAILSPRVTDQQLHSYAILIQGDDGKPYTASSEDRKWQVAKKGYCVDTLLYRYPPWEFDKANTFFNARLDELSVCPGEKEPVPAEPAKLPAEKPGSVEGSSGSG